jgi:hypothetical protein
VAGFTLQMGKVGLTFWGCATDILGVPHDELGATLIYFT